MTATKRKQKQRQAHSKHRPSHHLHRTLRQRAEEGAAVVLGEDARFEDDDDAFVLLGADDSHDAQRVYVNVVENYFPCIAS